MRNKIRTRQHEIEDLGYNFIERPILQSGHIFQKITKDYGYDGMVIFFKNREITSREAFIQLKSTDKIQFSNREGAYVFDLSIRDLNLWLNQSKPVVLLLYDAQKESAFCLDLQDYFRENRTALRAVRKFVRVFIPENNCWTPNFAQNFLNKFLQ